LRDGQSFALAGLMDNSEIKSLSKVPVIGDIPILGALFRSKQYQKNETELMFIVTAQLVKPVRPDDLPQLRGVDGLRSNSPLGVEPKGEGIKGQSGFSTGTSENKPATQTPMPESASPAKPASIPATSSTAGTVSKLSPVLEEEPPPMPAAMPAQAKNQTDVTP
jgi:pilus assembly protein CpaC